MDSVTDKELFISPLWNMIYIQPPMMDICKNIPNTIRIRLYVALVNEHRRNQHRKRLYLEGNIFKSLCIRLKNKYRSDKGFKTTVKIHKGLISLKTLDIGADLSIVKLILARGKTPSKNVFSWLLVRLQSYAKLLERIICCSKQSARGLYYRLKTGHNWIEVISTISLLARIWCLSKYLLKETCEDYNRIRSTIDLLPNDRENWLPSGYELPSNLNIWIGLKAPQVKKIKNNNDSSNGSIYNTHINARKVPYTVEVVDKFLKSEEWNRITNPPEHCITKNLDLLQWNMFKKRMTCLNIQMQKETNGEKDRHKLQRKIENEFKVWFLNKRIKR